MGVGGSHGGVSLRVNIGGGGAAVCYDRPVYRPVEHCDLPETRLRSRVCIDGREVEAVVTLWYDRRGDLHARVHLESCERRGVDDIRVCLEGERGRREWRPALRGVEDCDRRTAEFVTVGGSCWDAPRFDLSLRLSTHCETRTVEWCGVQVPS
jgi:hypothetical protein